VPAIKRRGEQSRDRCTEIIPPLLVKPLAEHEAEVRPKLRQVAETARSKWAAYDQGGNMVKPGGCDSLLFVH
jgi:hypothetical protein